MSRIVPYDVLLAVTKTKGRKVHVLQELSHCHHVDQAITLFTAYCLVAEALGIQEMGYKMGRVSFHGSEDHEW